MLNQEEIHRYFNYLSGAKRIEFLYGLLHLCQPLELRYLGTCLEEIARKDYEYLYHAEQKTNHLLTQSSTSPTSNNNEQNHQQEDILSDEKFDLTDQFTRAHAIVDIALLWAKNYTCAIRLFHRLKASESIKLVDMLLERDDLDERTMDEILIIFCLAANHPAFTFDMRTQISQIFKELEKRQRKMKLLQTPHDNDDEIRLDQATSLDYHVPLSIHNSNTLNVHASPLLTHLMVVDFDMDSSLIRILIRADWSDNNSTLTWKTLNDIRSFHLQLSNIVYHDDLRLERLVNISGYLRDNSSSTESGIELMKKNIEIYIAHLVYFSSYISTISTLAKFFNSSLKLVDSKQHLFNSNHILDDSLSISSYPNGIVSQQYELSIQQQPDCSNKSLPSPKLSWNVNKCKQVRPTIISTHNSTQTALEVRNEETQTDRMPGPGFILVEHQDYLRRYSMNELAHLTPNDLILDGLDRSTAQLLCNALDDLKPMSVHLNNTDKTVHSPCKSSQKPSPSLPPSLDTALKKAVQKQELSRASPPAFDRSQPEYVSNNFPGIRPSLSSKSSPKLSRIRTVTSENINGILPSIPLPSFPPLSTSSSAVAVTTTTATTTTAITNCPSQNQHHVTLLPTHSFLYNPIEPCIFPITIPPSFPSVSPDFVRLFAPNIGTVGTTNRINSSSANFVTNSNGSQSLMPNTCSTTQSNGTSTSSEQYEQNFHHRSSSTSSIVSRQQPSSYYRHKQHYPMDSHQFQQNICHSHHYQQRQCQIPYLQHQHNRPKACYTCGDLGHLAFACPEQYLSDPNYSYHTKDGYKLDYRPRQNTSTHFHHQQQQRQIRSNSSSKTKLRDNN